MDPTVEVEVASSAGYSSVVMIPALVIGLVGIIALWKIFSKAGKPGIASIVPIWNVIVLLQISGKPLWWFILMLIPVVNLVIVILVYVALANNFGKGAGFAVGMLLLPIIFLPILGFGSAQYLAGAEEAVE